MTNVEAREGQPAWQQTLTNVGVRHPFFPDTDHLAKFTDDPRSRELAQLAGAPQQPLRSLIKR
jgi:hypothetical protein